MERQQAQSGGRGRAQPRPYGDHLAECFWLEKPKSHVTRALTRGELAVTQIKSDVPTPEPSQSIPYDEAYLVGLMVEDVPDHELWQDGRSVKTPPFRRGQTALYDLRRDPISFTRTAHHSLHFYLPRAVLREIGEQAGRHGTDELRFRFATGYDDSVVRQLGAIVVPALERGEALDGLFLDHLLQALAVHVARSYGSAEKPIPSSVRGGLTPRQLRLAQDMMNAHLASDISLKQLAQKCDLSVTHFARAFRLSTGTAPYRWLQERRLAKAKAMLREDGTSLPDIAAACGFADQSHFTRTFSKHVGISPGRWRRS